MALVFADDAAADLEAGIILNEQPSQKNKLKQNCSRCDTEFGIFTYKYECSICHLLCCSNCAPKRYIQSVYKRICIRCYETAIPLVVSNTDLVSDSCQICEQSFSIFSHSYKCSKCASQVCSVCIQDNSQEKGSLICSRCVSESKLFQLRDTEIKNSPSQIPPSPNTISPSTSVTSYCSKCGISFTVFRPSKKCKRCWLSVCSSCASTYMALPNSTKKVRLCDDCVSEIKSENAHHLLSEEQNWFSNKPFRSKTRSNGLFKPSPKAALPTIRVSEFMKNDDLSSQRFILQKTPSTKKFSEVLSDVQKDILARDMKKYQLDKKELNILIEKQHLELEKYRKSIINIKKQLQNKIPTGRLSKPEEQKNKESNDPTELNDDLKRLEIAYARLTKSKIDNELERYFPQRKQWKFRICAEPGMFIGAKDLTIDIISGKFGIFIRNSRVLCELFSCQIVLQVTQFSIEGYSNSAKVLGSFLSPQYVSLLLECKHILLPMVFTKENKWECDRKNRIFRINVVKEISGAVTLPDGILQWIVDTFLPNIIESLVCSSLPVELGNFLSTAENFARLSGSFEINGSIPCDIWSADLTLNSPQSAEARHILDISIAQTFLFVQLIRVCEQTELKPLSLQTMFSYYLKYCVDTKGWTNILLKWHAMIVEAEKAYFQWHGAQETKTTGKHWFLSVWEKLIEAGKKRINIRAKLSELSISCEMSTLFSMAKAFYLRIVQARLDAQSRHLDFSKSTKSLSLHQGEIRLKEAVSYFDEIITSVTHVLNFIPSLSMALNFVFTGGDRSTLAFQAKDLQSQVNIFPFSSTFDPFAYAVFLAIASGAMDVNLSRNDDDEICISITLHSSEKKEKQKLDYLIKLKEFEFKFLPYAKKTHPIVNFQLQPSDTSSKPCGTTLFSLNSLSFNGPIWPIFSTEDMNIFGIFNRIVFDALQKNPEAFPQISKVLNTNFNSNFECTDLKIPEPEELVEPIDYSPLNFDPVAFIFPYLSESQHSLKVISSLFLSFFLRDQRNFLNISSETENEEFCVEFEVTDTIEKIFTHVMNLMYLL